MLPRRTVLTLPLGLAMPALAQRAPVKVGVINSFSGPFAIYGANMRMGLEAWMDGKDGELAGRKIEFVYRDLPQANPAQAKALGQELIVKDKVDFLAGTVFTPDGMAVAPLSEQAKIPFVVLNATGSAITARSPYAVRTSFTLPQVTGPLGTFVAGQGGKRAVTTVSDYAPGQDAEGAFRKTFAAAGGAVAESIRMPLATNDFGPIMQRVSNAGVDTVFAFLPAGPPSVAYLRSYIENGLKEKGVRVFTTGDVVWEPDLPAFGDAGLGIVSAHHYAVSHDSPENTAFIEKVRRTGGRVDDLAFPAAAGFDGAMLIERMLQATEGAPNPSRMIEAVRDHAWVSPRGPVRIDPANRHIRQTVYMRRIENRPDGGHLNREFASYPDQGDPGVTA